MLAVAGFKAEAQRVIRQVEEQSKGGYFCPYEIGVAYVSLGDADTAHRWFRKGIEERADCMAWLGVEPWMEPFRADPRYPACSGRLDSIPPAFDHADFLLSTLELRPPVLAYLSEG